VAFVPIVWTLIVGGAIVLVLAIWAMLAVPRAPAVAVDEPVARERIAA
jgi:hypothetical protein